MKTVISIVAGLAIAYLGFFVIDPMIVNWLLSLFPESAIEWMRIINLVVWVVVVICTGGLIIAISSLVGMGVSLFFKD